MRIYPDLLGDRLRAVAGDALFLSTLLCCFWLGSFVHASVAELDVLGRGVQRAGTQVNDAFAATAKRVDGTPIVGDDLGDALHDAGSRTSRPVVRAGTRGRAAVADLATLLGWLSGGLPAAVVTLWFLPGRIARMRHLLAARRVFAATTADPEIRRLLAMRAAFSLPFEVLLRHTRDPLGDLHAGRLEPLLAAIGDEYGLAA